MRSTTSPGPGPAPADDTVVDLTDTGSARRRQATLAAKLNVFAGQPEFASRAESLKYLATDLNSGSSERIASWHGVSLHTMFPTDEIAVASPGREKARLLTHVSHVLVVVPILVTWAGLSDAARGYEALTSERGEVPVEPFFALWQTGFDGHSLFSFGMVAFASLVAMALFACAQLGSRVKWHRIENEEEAARSQLSDHFSVVLAGVQLAVSEEHSMLPWKLEQRLQRGAALIEQASNTTLQAMENIKASSADVVNAITVQLSDIQKTQVQLQGLTKNLSDAAEELSRTNVAAVGPAVDRVGAQMDNLVKQTAQAGTDLAAQVAAKDDAVQAILTKIAADASKTAADASKTNADLVALLDTRVATIQQALTSFTRDESARAALTSDSLKATLEKLAADVASAEHLHGISAGAAQAQLSSLEAILDRLERLTDALSRIEHGGDDDR